MSTDVRIEARTYLLLEAVERADMCISGDGRVSESDAGELLGFEAGTLKKLRELGRAPTFHRLGVGNGSRVSYAVSDLAAWVEAHRVEQ